MHTNTASILRRDIFAGGKGLFDDSCRFATEISFPLDACLPGFLFESLRDNFFLADFRFFFIIRHPSTL
jgi:hypothetical protein